MGFYTWLDMRTGRWAPLFKVAAPLGVLGGVVYTWTIAAEAVVPTDGVPGGQIVGGILMGLAVVLALAGFIGLVAAGPNRD